MNYPVDLKRREAAAVRLRREIAKVPAPSAEEARQARAEADPPGSDGDELPPRTVGLAFSGGGIRSATFCLGVLQALAKYGRLRHIDFLSTVSGGGYTGSFLGRLFTRGAIAGLAKSGGDPCARVEKIVADSGSPQLQWLRAHANYIVSAGNSDLRDHLAVFWRNLSSIYLLLFFLGLSL